MWNKDGAGAVGEALHRSADGLRLREQPLHLRERGCIADGGRAQDEHAVEIERTAETRSPRARVTGSGSPVSIDSSTELRPSMIDAVDWDAVACEHAEDVAGGERVDRQNGLRCGGEVGCSRWIDIEQACRRRGELRESADGARRLAARACFQPAAREQKTKDEDDGLEVDICAGGAGADGREDEAANALSVPMATSVFMFVVRWRAARHAPT